jgi:hypothetical protein
MYALKGDKCKKKMSKAFELNKPSGFLNMCLNTVLL